MVRYRRSSTVSAVDDSLLCSEWTGTSYYSFVWSAGEIVVDPIRSRSLVDSSHSSSTYCSIDRMFLTRGSNSVKYPSPPECSRGGPECKATSELGSRSFHHELDKDPMECEGIHFPSTNIANSPSLAIGRSPIVLLLVSTSIAAHPSALVSVYVPRRLWVETRPLCGAQRTSSNKYLAKVHEECCVHRSWMLF